MVKLVDALDSKSSGTCARGGSIPPSGTKNVKHLGLSNAPNAFTTRLLAIKTAESLFFTDALEIRLFIFRNLVTVLVTTL